MNLIDYRASRIAAFAVGAFILLAATLLSQSLWDAIARATLLAVVAFAMMFAPKRLGVLSWSAGVPAFYGLFFLLLPLPQTLYGNNPLESDHGTANALLIAASGLFAFFVGAMTVHLTKKPPSTFAIAKVHPLDILEKPTAIAIAITVASIALLWSYFFGYFGLIATTGQDVAGGAGLISAITFFLPIAHVVSWNQFLLKRDRHFLLLGTISTVVMLAFGLLANSKGQLVLPFFLIALCAWGASAKFPLRLLVLSIFLYVFVAFPLVTASRIALQSGFADSRSELAQLTFDYLVSGQWMTDATDFSARESFDRGLLAYFARIVQEAGTSVPLMHGATLVQGFEVFVPRILFPDKPDMNIGNWTAQAFGLVDSGDDVTNLSPTFIGELYMNFDFGGVLLGMLLLGGLAVVVDRYLIVDRGSWTMPIMVLAIGWQESLIGHTILPFIKNALLLIVLLLLVSYCTKLARLAASPSARGADR